LPGLKSWDHYTPYVTAAVYSHVLKGRDREAARKWEEFQKANANKENGPNETRIV
jgi:hypothetical protein